MKEVIHKMASVTMAFLLLLSTTSWKVEKHYCMGRLMDMALFVKADDCGMDMAFSDNDSTEFQEQYPCCDDEVIFIDGQDDLKISFNDLDIEKQHFISVFLFSGIDLFPSSPESQVSYLKYPPPILVKNIQLLDEVFLI